MEYLEMKIFENANNLTVNFWGSGFIFSKIDVVFLKLWEILCGKGLAGGSLKNIAPEWKKLCWVKYYPHFSHFENWQVYKRKRQEF